MVVSFFEKAVSTLFT